MPKQRYKVVGPFPAYGVNTGDVVEVDSADPLVQANITNGVIALEGDAPAPAQMPCPACIAEGKKRPPKFTTQDELDEHYSERHKGLVAPQWKEEGESQ